MNEKVIMLIIEIYLSNFKGSLSIGYHALNVVSFKEVNFLFKLFDSVDHFLKIFDAVSFFEFCIDSLYSAFETNSIEKQKTNKYDIECGKETTQPRNAIEQ